VEALKKACEWGERIPIGVFYRDDRPKRSFGDQFMDKILVGRLTELGFRKQQTIVEMLDRFR